MCRGQDHVALALADAQGVQQGDGARADQLGVHTEADEVTRGGAEIVGDIKGRAPLDLGQGVYQLTQHAGVVPEGAVQGDHHLLTALVPVDDRHVAHVTDREPASGAQVDLHVIRGQLGDGRDELIEPHSDSPRLSLPISPRSWSGENG